MPNHTPRRADGKPQGSKRADQYAQELLRLASAEEQHHYLMTQVPPLIRARVRDMAELIHFSTAVKERTGIGGKKRSPF